GLAVNGYDVHLLYSPSRAEDRFIQRINELKNEIKTGQIPMERSVSPRDDLSALFKIKEYIRENGPFDLVHGHSSKAGALVRLLRLVGTHGSRIVYTPHAFITLSPNLSTKEKLIYKTIERGLGSLFTDAVVAVSNHEAQHALALGIPQGKVNVIANGIEPVDDTSKQRAQYRKSLGFDEGEIVIGFSGRLDYQKAPEILIKAFLEIDSDLSTHLVMLGDGPKWQELEELARGHEKESRIHFMGYHPFAAAVLNAMDIFVLPSRYEGLPYVLLEAMVAGLPVIATSVGGNGELVRDGINGLIVEPDSVSDLTNALGILVNDGDLRAFFGRSSLEIVKSSYGMDLMIESTIDLYKNLRKSG
ncbi:MAG: glycosyltransferase, partial [Rubrobacteridae bacterium]|nr:glycosyltransferase [Rubrobacteridae bacterium]